MYYEYIYIDIFQVSSFISKDNLVVTIYMIIMYKFI